MQVVNCRLDVICKDKDDNEYKMFCQNYEESIDEIKVRTQIYTTELRRGWVGDLCYSAWDNRDLETGDRVDLDVTERYKDVLLKSVNVWEIDEGATTWEYTFFKK